MIFWAFPNLRLILYIRVGKGFSKFLLQISVPSNYCQTTERQEEENVPLSN